MDCSVDETIVIRDLQEPNSIVLAKYSLIWGFQQLHRALATRKVYVSACAQSCLTLTPWTGVHQALLSMELSRQEYWNGLPFPFPGDLPDPETKPIASLATKNNENHLLSLPLYTVTFLTEVQRNILSQLVDWAAAYYTQDTIKDLILHRCKELCGHKMPKTYPLPFSLLRHRQFNAEETVINALPWMQ